MKNVTKNKIDAINAIAINGKLDVDTRPEFAQELKLTLLSLKEAGLVKSSTRCITKKSAVVQMYREKFVFTEKGEYVAKMLNSVIENLFTNL